MSSQEVRPKVKVRIRPSEGNEGQAQPSDESVCPQ